MLHHPCLPPTNGGIAEDHTLISNPSKHNNYRTRYPRSTVKFFLFFHCISIKDCVFP
ncbi:hypothetical protein RHMOL_Rhmol13G0215000 [Rhododendron molle]|uniref:Uncharacterized protein n=1 Tax=Rhododendron molle TaxID=49168 RepID=A0ACC0L902_RHOML|nr:hypothetical protein RHMOL_Rhmol13G0215000 [Rhododendron molle]